MGEDRLVTTQCLEGMYIFGYISDQMSSVSQIFELSNPGPQVWGRLLLLSAGTDLTTAKPASRWDPAGTGGLYGRSL